MKESPAPDTTLAHYLIGSRIGVGGMGEVYRAKDTKLNRDVAIKILPEAFAQDEDRVARFKREAQVLASLNHPNIAAIYGIEESDGIRALVMELVEGPTLAYRIAASPIPLDEAVVVISPDGRWLAYESNEGGRFQVYVRPFPSVSGGRWQVSTTVGFEPSWRSDGRALFFRSPPGEIWEVAVEPGQAFAAGSPTRVAEGNYQDDLGRQFDVAPGGQKLLLIRRDPRDIETEPIHVVLNWAAELDKRTQDK